MTKRISIDERILFDNIVAMLRRAQVDALIKSLYVDEQSYNITALSEYGEWSFKLSPPKERK